MTLVNSAQETSWQPLLRNADADEALGIVMAIAAQLEAQPPLAGTLGGGAADVALLLHYLTIAFPDGRYDYAAANFINAVTESIANQTRGPALYGGVSGLAWLLAHARAEAFDFTEIDEALKSFLLGGRHCKPELVAGLTGIGVYELERVPAPVAVESLRTIVVRLDQLASRLPHGVSWFTTPALLTEKQRMQSPDGHFDLGVAHGVTGPIWLLGHLSALGIIPELSGPLFTQAISWLLTQERRPEKGAVFPYVTGGRRRADLPRVAWCYSDLGIAGVLHDVASALGDDSLRTEALRVASVAADRPHGQDGVRDASLCHGAAGNGHIFNRLYHATNDNRFASAARRWFKTTLEFHSPGRGIAGFEYHAGEGQPTANPSFLEGAVGIALALLSAACPVEPKWDRLLLLSHGGALG